ncbi:Peregrin [Grifola frondosa]|uniref:Peregrin n=1 Tax=Grifola frondosa TaxID=5627 RepID=A0A1C7M9Y0_GRIFR|nr:Peregrin [Grifola frondosa]
MARGVATPPPTPLPKVSFIKVQDDVTAQPPGVHDQQARSYGYNDFSDFTRPEYYIRYIEPLESELAVQVEYDMDEQDQEWLDAINAERRKEHLDKVSYETFEIVMDRLEKEWFDLTKNIPKPDLALPSEDSTCAICDDSEGENTNAIVFCDGCNLAVHQDCYGVPYIPEGQWLCRKCTVSPENPVSCILCPNEGGAFKQTVHGDWVHLLCAIWVPETRVANDVFMEPITGVDKISKQRWKLKCSICDVREGACIQCTKTSCFLAFHATCARKEKLLMPMKATQGSEAPTLACYCEKHLPKEQQEARAAAFSAEHVDGYASDGAHVDSKTSKSARAYAKTYKPGPPLVPHIIVERIMQYIGRISIRQKRDFVLMYMKRLRQDLESVRLLTDLTRKREAAKREQIDAMQGVFSTLLFRHHQPLRMAFEKIVSHDRNEYFKNPVSKVEVPDYFDIIKHPMCWNTIDRKLDKHEYFDLQEFRDDMNLVINNAITYNKPGTPFYKAAQRVKTAAEPILAELDRYVERHSLLNVSGEVPETPETRPPIGDLEPPLHLLDFLVSEDSIKNDIDLILSADPPKRDRRADLERKRLERLGQLDSSPGFRAPRTRRAVAAAAAFEAEVTGKAESPEAVPTDETVVMEEELPVSPSQSRKHKRAPAPPPPELPLTVEDVDNQQSFMRFDQGWVLPEGQRRGGRAPVERQTLPPPKKKVKKDRGKSQLSSFSTSAAENTTLRASPPLASSASAPSAFWTGERPPVFSVGEGPSELSGGETQSTRSIVDGPPAFAAVEMATASPGGEAPVPSAAEVTAHVPSVPSAVEASPLLSPIETASAPETHPISSDNEPPAPQETEEVAMDVDEPVAETEPQDVEQEIVEETLASKQPVGPIIIEELDTPATRREKNMRRKAEKLASQAAAEAVETVIAQRAQADVSHSPASAATQATSLEPVPEPAPAETEPEPAKPEASKLPPGRIIIIEELDTPATRREKNMRRKAERLAAAAAAAAVEGSQLHPPPVAGPSHIPDVDENVHGHDHSDAESELTALTYSEAADDFHWLVPETKPEPASQSPRKPISVSAPAELGAFVLRPGEILEGGTLVWAKADTFPWWPAVIYEPDDTRIPPTVLEHPKADDPACHLVQFFDHNRSWAWLELNRLKQLGEDDTLDQTMLAPHSAIISPSQWHTMVEPCALLSREAMAEKETDGDENDEGRRNSTVTEPTESDPVQEDPSSAVLAALGADSPMTEVDL